MKRNREAVADLTPPRPPPSFLGKIKRIAKGRKAGRVSGKKPPPPPTFLSSRSGSATAKDAKD